MQVHKAQNVTPSQAERLPVSPAGAPSDARDLARELGRCLPAFPILAAQLREVSESVEGAVVKVCGIFMNIADRARQSAGQVAHLSGGTRQSSDESAGVNELVADTRELLQNLLRRIEQTNESSLVAVSRLEAVEKKIAQINEALVTIDEVTSQARILALNGRLEAARAGVHGTAFAVVAQETAKMAADARSSCKATQDLIHDIAKSLQETSHELHARAGADTREAARSQEEVGRSLGSMESLHRSIEQALALSEQSSQQLARDIAVSVQTLQFQDAVSQRIGHVVHMLEEFHQSLGAQLGTAGIDQAQLAQADWVAAMAKDYTMQSERQILAAQVGDLAPAACEAGNDVELF